ncbi:MAG: OmpA family protein [Aquabacterium sp.]|nr:OmpA family protein [Aquabacterium sp.]
MTTLQSPTLRARAAWPLAVLALAAITACSSVPPANARLDDARSQLRATRADPQTHGLGGPELQNATTALNAAESALARGADSAEIDHLAYLASQRTVLLQQAGQRRTAEVAVAQATGQRDQQRLAARTQEADSAQRSAVASQREAQSAQRDAQSAQLDAEAAQRDAQVAQRQAGASQLQAGEAERRSAQLAQQLKDMDARQTDRGLVVTIGDVLFDTDQAQIRSGAQRSMDKLVVFLQAYPMRRAVVEGFTDSTGGADHNLALSARRADAVRAALVSAGVNADRIATKGFGEAYPVAGNADAGGRQMNRRVEIVLSDDSGQIPAR